MTDFQKITWQSPSNIALIKYWGKHGHQLPCNPSLSMTLDKARTTTSMYYRADSHGLKVKYLFEGKKQEEFEMKILKLMISLQDEMPFLNQYEFRFESSNNFPHSAGIASSASSMSALALCLVSLEEILLKENYSREDFLKRASHIARLGSGSASRSIFGNYALWGHTDDLEQSSDEYAIPFTLPVHEKFAAMGDAVLLVSSQQKSVSSSLGHHLMTVHPFAEARYKQAETNLQALMVCLQVGDFESFACIVENEALTLHSLLMTSSDDGLLLKANTLHIIDEIRRFRSETGLQMCFTLDAGPNVHLLYPLGEREKVMDFITFRLLRFCENEQWIDDQIGTGPVCTECHSMERSS
ncbi:MAG: diphosphomevalonate decarboxylase [Prolixibacteraceae bacterium]|nr:diphosphomevalonate decarboxylase [Prolixibacteraceae bacterium]